LFISDPIWNPDSYSYIKFAEWLLNSSSAFNDVFYLTIRTPGYPLILALSMLFFNYPNYVFVTHSILGVLAAYIFLKLIDQPKSFAKKSFALLCSYILLCFFYVSIMTEWIAFTLILISLALSYKTYKSRNTFNFFLLGLVTGFLILVRPALILFPIALIIIGILNHAKKIQLTIMMLATLLTLSPWLSFNYLRFNKITLAEFGGYNLAGVAMAIDKSETTSKDSKELVDYITRLNNKRFQQNDMLKASLAEIRHKITYNIWQVAFNEAYTSNMQISTGNNFAEIYATRVISRNLKTYLIFLLKQFQAYLFNFPLVLFSIYLLNKLSKKEALKPLYITLLTAICFDLSNFFLCSLFVPIIPRFLLLTGVPLMLISSLSLFTLAERGNDG
ncbi:MAG: hypothetical protein KDD56_03555, partial [Bdellovibrionales bacterium]|nr:hypothetical protein [Bdellovibrionales bacterium]